VHLPSAGCKTFVANHGNLPESIFKHMLNLLLQGNFTLTLYGLVGKDKNSTLAQRFPMQFRHTCFYLTDRMADYIQLPSMASGFGFFINIEKKFSICLKKYQLETELFSNPSGRLLNLFQYASSFLFFCYTQLKRQWVKGRAGSIP
jgi:hypothetical protein